MKTQFRWVSRIEDISADAWDAMARPLETPLLEWEWLRQMEVSGSIAPAAGWQPQHLTVWQGERLVAAAPLYIKSHSEGEFVFDYAWADLAQRLGVPYYPKLVGMIPVTPVTGYRFLIADSENEHRLTQMMLAEIERFCQHNRLPGCSFLFVDPVWQGSLQSNDLIGWRHQSFDWENPGFESFEDYLTVFNTNQRKNIRKERQKMAVSGIVIKPFAGKDISRQMLLDMYRFYEKTNDQWGPWGCKYLTREFFMGLHQRYRHRLLMMVAYLGQNGDKPVGASLFLTKDKVLLGRYWGCRQFINALHFNVCYYSPIEWAIENGIRHFDPGMGSAHKARRGFVSRSNYSFHRFFDPRMQYLLKKHIDQINQLQQQEIEVLNDSLPFAQQGSATIQKNLRSPK